MAKDIRVGTRGSPLALRQTDDVLARLRAAHPGLRFHRREITTRGDVVLSKTFSEFGERGVFVKELEVALLDGSIDVAVHSLKDMPTEQPEGLIVAAVVGRADPRDALVLAARHRERGLTLATLPEGARIGTGSTRRVAQLRAMRADLRVEPVRGNLQTRLRKLEEEGFDALILAAAGLDRLDMGHLIAERIPLDVCLPAPGQGALGLETRADDDDTVELVRRVEDAPVRAATDAERTVLAALGGGCHVPVGAYGRVEGGRLELEGCVLAPDGSASLRARVEGPAADAVALGQELARVLQERGADELLARFAAGQE